jgi:hypothetical protein
MSVAKVKGGCRSERIVEQGVCYDGNGFKWKTILGETRVKEYQPN